MFHWVKLDSFLFSLYATHLNDASVFCGHPLDGPAEHAVVKHPHRYNRDLKQVISLKQHFDETTFFSETMHSCSQLLFRTKNLM